MAKRISKATGGKNARMPHWFQYSLNGRKEAQVGKKKKNYAKPNNSTMNRICASFDDIGNINMNLAGIAPFNWQMLLSEPCRGAWPEAVELFCSMDSSNTAAVIQAQTETRYQDERSKVNGYALLANSIVDEINNQFGLLEDVYPYIAKSLFAGEGFDKSVHKQMFWRVFGSIALRNIKTNLETGDVCERCGMRIPAWVEKHQCAKNSKGFFECIDCGKMCERVNAKQCRCDRCQEQHKRSLSRKRQSAFRTRWNEREEAKSQSTTSLQSRWTKTP